MRLKNVQDSTQLLEVALLLALIVVHISGSAVECLLAAVLEIDMKLAASAAVSTAAKLAMRVDYLVASAISDMGARLDTLAIAVLSFHDVTGIVASPPRHCIHSADSVWASKSSSRQ